jgi:UDP-N-acetylglucosamine 4,6-dehydratase
MNGVEIFVPKIPSMRLTDLAEALAPGCKQEILGIRPGEKLHELLISCDEARHGVEYEDMFLIHPGNPWTTNPHLNGGKPVSADFMYASDTNSQWLTHDEFKLLMREQAC